MSFLFPPVLWGDPDPGGHRNRQHPFPLSKCPKSWAGLRGLPLLETLSLIDIQAVPSLNSHSHSVLPINPYPHPQTGKAGGE